MNQELRYILGMSCMLPAIIGLWRYKQIEKKYRLLIYLMLMPAIVETVVLIGKQNIALTSVANLCVNIYILVNFMVFLQFVKQNGYMRVILQHYFIAAAGVVAIFNWIKVGTLFAYFFFLLCFASTVMLFVSINILSKQVMVVNTSLNKNVWFWVSILFVIQYAYMLLVFGLYVFSLLDTPNGKVIGIINTYVNAGCYLLFTIAMLRIPKRKDIFIHKTS